MPLMLFGKNFFKPVHLSLCNPPQRKSRIGTLEPPALLVPSFKAVSGPRFALLVRCQIHNEHLEVLPDGAAGLVKGALAAGSRFSSALRRIAQSPTASRRLPKLSTPLPVRASSTIFMHASNFDCCWRLKFPVERIS
jgi:hypothetical protein